MAPSPGPEVPVILAVAAPDHCPLVREALESRYGRHYRILVAADTEPLTPPLLSASVGGHEVALVLASRSVGGLQALAVAHGLHPHARRALLLGWSEERAEREEVVRILGLGQADVVVLRPALASDERFHRGVTENLDQWWRLRGRPYSDVCIVGDPHAPFVQFLREALHRHDVAYECLAPGSPRAAELGTVDSPAGGPPVVAVRGGRVLIDPTPVQVADALGARTRPASDSYDVAVVGAGPAGLAAAVYAASEGLRTALLERDAMGGQAGTSSLIRNYLGFPHGVSGAELAARAFEQAMLFGAEMVFTGDAVELAVGGGAYHVVRLSNGDEVRTRAVVLATGVSYRLLDAPGLPDFVGRGVHYGSAMSEARLLQGEHVVVAGGGNSAGQAALHLARFARSVVLAVRGRTLAASMSAYLVDAITRTGNVDVRFGCEVVRARGESRLCTLLLRDRDSGTVTELPAAALFVLIGAVPRTGWLPDAIERDDYGYVRAATDFATSVPGVYAVGDVRAGSIKRVASATGEGAACIRSVHEYLSAEALPEQRPVPSST